MEGLAALGYWTDVRLAMLVAAAWTGHVGADRLVGYGLEYESGSRDAHLSTRALSVSGPTESE